MTASSFRNVDADPADPVETWPAEAIAATLQRGGLGQWRRIAASIKADPWGRVARCVQDEVESDPPYGAGPLMAEIVRRAREARQAEERAVVAAEVTDLVTRSGRTQVEFAAAIGTSASRLSTYVRGAVVPSAALLVRMRRAAADAGPVRSD